MALSVARQRRPRAEDQGASSSSSSTSDRYWKGEKGEKEEERAGVGWFLPALLLGLLRHMSASSNIIHDCDEVFNYWEPLHYLLYKSGFQTWEYRFLYPIYPLICIAATVVIDSFPGLFRDKYAVEDSLIVMIAKGLRPIFLGIILCASHSGTFSILNGYFAPLEIYKHLDHHNAIGNGKVFFCLGFFDGLSILAFDMLVKEPLEIYMN
ncbi:hypothetical protein ZIOFF_044900 [Zingiber officinale]|uniref:Mannosyltransferase n=1 Tax=Zingiber officinale TaxID=94328 RepID=A0A8J5FW40_ZINOF|nr:hypothetical protein ZIOFF_044900 [Zingiber officinale]